jgi:sulfatase modifying factor 1
MTLPLAGVVSVVATITVFSTACGSKTESTQPAPVSTQQAPVVSKVNPKDGLTYAWIPPGSFTMGCSGDDECRTAIEGDEPDKPAHPVTITKGFWMGQTTVTSGAWKRYADRLRKVMPPAPKDNPGWADDRLPMVMIMWGEASEFCVAAGGRLPTEAEWEYAARAGTAGPRYGNLDAIAWYADNSGRKRIDSVALLTHRSPYGAPDWERVDDALQANGNGMKPVGLKQPNAWSLYDMLGNVSQWTADWYDKRYYQQKDALDPQGPPGDLADELLKDPDSRRPKVARGGSWASFPQEIRASGRSGSFPSSSSGAYGFRCVSN